MEKQVLSIEQIQELVDFGLDVSKTSMYWRDKTYEINSFNYQTPKLYIMDVDFRKGIDIPTLTVNDILTLIQSSTLEKGYRVCLCSDEDVWAVELWDTYLIYCTEGNDTQIEALFNMLKYCLKNNII